MASSVADHRKQKNRKGFTVSVNGSGGVLILGGALIAIGAAFLYRRCRTNKKTPPPSSLPDHDHEAHCKQANDGLKPIKPIDDVQVSTYETKTEEADGKETIEDGTKMQKMEADEVVESIVADIKIQEVKIHEANDLAKTIEVRHDEKREEMEREENDKKIEAIESILPVTKLVYDDEEAEATETTIGEHETESSGSSSEAVWPAELIGEIESHNEKPESETVELQANEGAELMTEVKEKIAEGVEATKEKIGDGVEAATKMATTITGKYDYVNVLMHFLALLMVLVMILLCVRTFPSKD